MDLVEREAPSRLLAECADEARRGEGRLVLVAGEAGVGKSALVDWLRQDLPEKRWLWGACDSLFTPRPLGPLLDLAEQLGGPLLELCRTGADREELFRALLRQVGDAGTLDVLVVEDVHWADEATLDLLRFLSRRLRDAPVLLLVTYRDDGLSTADPLSVALGDLATQRLTRRIELAPLSMDAVHTLADGSDFDPSELFRLTGGNPFYLTEVLQSGIGTVPASARDATLARALRLDDRSRTVLETAALIGARVDLRLLESITGCTSSTVDALLACGLLVGEGGWLRFRHEIARLAVEQAIAPHRGRSIHGRILDALVARGRGDDAQLAFHAEAAGNALAVLRFAPAAARRAAELASHREATAQFERALRFAAEADADAPTVAGLYDGLADELSLADRWPDAADATERALVLWREVGDRLREGDTLRRLARTVWNQCRGQEASTTARAAISTLEPLGPTVELSRAYATLATQQMLYSQYDAAADLALRAQAIAARFAAMDVHSDALTTQAVCSAKTGKEWSGQMRQALDIALAAHLPEPAARAYCNFCHTYGALRQFAEAEKYLAEGIAYCDERDLGTYATFMRGERANIFERTGRWDEAVELTDQVLAESGSSPANRICAVRSLGTVHARRGEPRAWEYLDEAAAIADMGSGPLETVAVRLARAEAYWLEGRHAEARSEAERADDVCADCDAWDRGAVAVWLSRTGSARPVRGEVAEPYRLHLDGEFDEAAARWTGLGCDYDAAMTLADAPEEAAVRRAVETLDRLTAYPAARIARQKLHPRSVRQALPFGLTPREREVLGLICSTHTNAEIATKLFISPKTVNHHVSAILSKMGAPNRNAAAHEAVRLGLLGD